MTVYKWQYILQYISLDNIIQQEYKLWENKQTLQMQVIQISTQYVSKWENKKQLDIIVQTFEQVEQYKHLTMTATHLPQIYFWHSSQLTEVLFCPLQCWKTHFFRFRVYTRSIGGHLLRKAPIRSSFTRARINYNVKLRSLRIPWKLFKYSVQQCQGRCKKHEQAICEFHIL